MRTFASFSTLVLLLAGPAAAQNLLWQHDGALAGEGTDVCVAPGGTVYWAGGTTAGDFQIEALAPDGTPLWSYLYDSGKYDYVGGVTCDAAGNLYVLGAAVVAGVQADLTVVSLDPAGALRWTWSWPGVSSSVDPGEVTVGPDGNLYLCGQLQDAANFSPNMVAASLTPTGAERWRFAYKDPAHKTATGWAEAIAVDPRDNSIYMAGTAGSHLGVTVVALDPSGSPRWQWNRKGTGFLTTDFATDVTVSLFHNIYLTASLHSSGTGDDFTVISLDPAGNERWTFTWGTGADDRAHAVAMGADGNIYAAGRTIEPAGPTMAVFALAPNSALLWASLEPPPNGDDGGQALALDVDGNVYVGGWSQAPGPGGSQDRQYAVRSVDRNGVLRWDWIAAADWGEVWNLAVDDEHSTVYAVGETFTAWTGTPKLAAFDTGALVLTQDPLHLGQGADLTVTGAAPGEQVWFVYSLAGLGVSPPISQLGGLHLGILPPIQIIGSATADPNGTAVRHIVVPPSAPLVDVFTQAAAVRGPGGADSVKSNPVSATILP